MDNLFDNPDNWFEHSEELTETTLDERLAFFLDTLRHPSFTAEFAEDAGVGDFLITLLGDFESEKRFEELIQLQKNIESSQPEFYAKEFAYINEPILAYALFKNEENLAKEAFAPFVEDPIKDIDVYLPLLRLIALYGKGEWLREIVLENYVTVRDEDGFVGSPAQELAIYMWYQTSENEYKKFKETGKFDMVSWLAELDKVDMDMFKDADIERIEHGFIHPIPAKDILIAEFQKEPAVLLRFLSNQFMKDNYDNKGIPFMVSGTIWDLMMEFWFRDGAKKMSLHLTTQSFDKYCVGLVGFFGNYYCNAVGIVNGAFYVYDFLHKIGLVDDALYSKALVGIRHCQDDVNNAGYRTWRNGFSKYWAKPDGMTDEEHATNMQAIDDAFAKVVVVEHKKQNLDNLWGKTIDALKPIANPKPIKQVPAPRPKPIATTPKVGRNEPCSCGSGKKYKHCCGK
jgi:hypothetical protein